MVAGQVVATRIGDALESMNLSPMDSLAERFDGPNGFRSPASLAFYELGRCPGTKIGGKPGFDRHGCRFEHFVTFATNEFDGASFRRWISVEDQRLIAPAGEPLTRQLLFPPTGIRLRPSELGVSLGRTQRAHVYVCRDREPWDVVAHVGD